MAQQQSNTNALEYLAQSLSAEGLTREKIESQIHDAVFLATVESAARTIGPRVTPTPLYRIEYDESTNKLEFKFLEGRGHVPKQGAVDIEIADLVIASLHCDRVPLLFEGITGTGKTYTVEQVLKSVYSPENSKGLRLNPNMSNVLQPYIEGRIDNGLLQVYINRDAIRRIAALFIDEQNRGDTNSVLGLLDNQVALATGERADLGLPVPMLVQGQNGIEVAFDERRLKPIAVYSAQNPSSAQYSGARSTDGAVGNRQVVVKYPNMALSSGAATVNMTVPFERQHEVFMNFFIERLGEYLGEYLNVGDGKLRALLLPAERAEENEARANLEYLALHAFAFEPRKARNRFLKSSVEVGDHIIMLAGGKGLAENFTDEVETANEWTTALAKYGVNFQYSASLDSKSEVVRRLDGVRAAFKEEFIQRDKTKADKIADALALIVRYKRAYQNARENNSSPIEEFKILEEPLTLRDIASAYAIVLNDKVQTTNGVSPISLINQAFTDYVNLLQEFMPRITGRTDRTAFNLKSPNDAIRYLACYVAVDSVKELDGAGADVYSTKMISRINQVAATIRGLDTGDETRKLLIARVNADLASFAGFIHEYRHQIAQRFNSVAPGNEVLPRYHALEEAVYQARGDVKTNYTLPRVERIFGI